MESTPKQVFRIGDEARGMHVLETMYAAQSERPVRVNLDALWRELGVRPAGAGQVSFDDNAPLVSVRRAIFLQRPSCLQRTP